jgi:Protein of unknown function (DUF1573)
MKLLSGPVSSGIVLLPFLFALAAHVIGPAPRPLSAGPLRPGIAFDQYLVDLGKTAPSEEVIAHFAFTNIGSSPVKIERCDASCGCMNPELTKRDYEPGESGRIMLRVHTPTQGSGLKEYRLTVVYNDGQTRQVDLTFRVELPDNQVSVRPRALYIYEQAGRETEHEIEVIDRRDRQLSIVRMESSKGIALLIQDTVEQDEHDHRHIKVRVVIPADRLPGRRDGWLRLFTDDAEFRELRIPIRIQTAESSSDSAKDTAGKTTGETGRDGRPLRQARATPKP